MDESQIKEVVIETMKLMNENEKKNYVYGQRGIADLFGCSIATASRILKSGRISDAVFKIGRKIVVDAEKALELTKVKQGGRKWVA